MFSYRYTPQQKNANFNIRKKQEYSFGSSPLYIVLKIQAREIKQNKNYRGISKMEKVKQFLFRDIIIIEKAYEIHA